MAYLVGANLLYFAYISARYHGGDMKNPTYRKMGDHTESVQVDYLPEKVSYDALLDIFWSNHSPRYRASTQYMSAIWYHDEEQKKTALASKEAVEKRGGPVATLIAPVKVFTWAEDYHQKYELRHHKEILEQLGFKNLETLVNSTVATR